MGLRPLAACPGRKRVTMSVDLPLGPGKHSPFPVTWSDRPDKPPSHNCGQFIYLDPITALGRGGGEVLARSSAAWVGKALRASVSLCKGTQGQTNRLARELRRPQPDQRGKTAQSPSAFSAFQPGVGWQATFEHRLGAEGVGWFIP